MKLWPGLRSSLLAVMVLAAMSLLVACGDDDDDDDGANGGNGGDGGGAQTLTPSSGAGSTEISVGDNVFSPESATISVGETVTWTWSGANPHSVVGEFAGENVSSEQQTSGSFEFTFDEAGTFDYICGVHGASMSGSITVE